MNAQSHLEQAHIPMSGLDEHIVSASAAPQPNPSSISAWFALARQHGAPFLRHELRQNRRVQLASAVSAIAVILVTSLSISIARQSTPQAEKTYGVAQNETPLAPAATLARQAAPHRPSSLSQPFKPSLDTSNGDDMAEFLRLGGRALATDTSPKSPSTLQTTPSASMNKVQDAPVSQAMAAVQPTTASSVMHTPSPVTDPVTMAATIQAAPMSDRKQLDVLELVTQLGTIIRDQRNEIAQLRSDETRLQHQIDQESEDHARRLSLIEARDAVQFAKAAGNVDKGASSPGAPAATPVKTVVASTQTTVRAPAADTIHSDPHRYHVQAASPGVAMLSELDASGGELRQIPVAPGDDLPGWGKVSSITQHGTTWLVKTDRGTIQ